MTHLQPAGSDHNSLYNMTVAGVGAFLRRHHLDQYVEVFASAAVDGDLLAVVEYEELINPDDDFKMTARHAKKLMNLIKRANHSLI